MRHLIQTLLVSLACLLASSSSTAIPVELILETGSKRGFTYSLIHTCTHWSCMSGVATDWLSGTLEGHLDEEGRLTDLSGTIHSDQGTSWAATGFFDFTPGGVGGELLLEGFGTFEFENRAMSGPANGFENGELFAWGGMSRGGQFVRGIDIGGRVVPAVPEPSAALLFGLGALVIGGGVRRRR